VRTETVQGNATGDVTLTVSSLSADTAVRLERR
jgi:hypothetical protein